MVLTKLPRLYPILDADALVRAGVPLDEAAHALYDAGVRWVQYRDKRASDAEVVERIRLLRAIFPAEESVLLLNDRVTLWAAAEADGVHIGQDDTPYPEARRLLGPDRTIGVTCHDSRHLAMEAAEAGADYVAFGAFFPTETKQAIGRPDLELLVDWQEIMQTPCVAIGGITVENCRPLVEAGADFLAVCSGVWRHSQGPAAAVKAFNAVFALPS